MTLSVSQCENTSEPFFLVVRDMSFFMGKMIMWKIFLTKDGQKVTNIGGQLRVVNAQLVDGLPSGYVRFLLDLDGKSTTRRHGFEMEGTLTTKD